MPTKKPKTFMIFPGEKGKLFIGVLTNYSYACNNYFHLTEVRILRPDETKTHLRKSKGENAGKIGPLICAGEPVTRRELNV